MILCAFSGHPDKLVQWVINDDFKVGEYHEMEKKKTLASIQIMNESEGAIVRKQHVDWQYCLEVKMDDRRAHLL